MTTSLRPFQPYMRSTSSSWADRHWTRLVAGSNNQHWTAGGMPKNRPTGPATSSTVASSTSPRDKANASPTATLTANPGRLAVVPTASDRPTSRRTTERTPLGRACLGDISGLPDSRDRRLCRTVRRWREQFQRPQRAINGFTELHRRIAHGYRKPGNYQLRMLLVAGRPPLPPQPSSTFYCCPASGRAGNGTVGAPRLAFVSEHTAAHPSSAP